MKTLEQIPVIPESGILIRQEGAVLRVFYDISKAPAPDVADDSEETPAPPEDLCECYNIDVDAPIEYGSIVAAIVNDKYSADDVQALSANYIDAKDPDSTILREKREEYLAEWSEYQAWRTSAKEIASTVISMLKD